MSSGQNSQYFAEYSLWNDSAYSRNVSFPIIQFSKSVFEDNILYAPTISDPPTVNNAVERDKQPSTTMVIPWYIENYYRKTQDSVKREDLFKDPDLFYGDEEEGEASGPDEAASGPATDYDSALGASYNYTSNLVDGYGNDMIQHSLETALAQPARIDRGASLLQRMGWDGGGLGRDGNGIIDPVTPNIQNQIYPRLGLGADQFQQTPLSKLPLISLKTPKPSLKTKEMKEIFKTNLLLSILEFVKNDLQSELLFDLDLKNSERRKIHMLVCALNGDEDIKKREDFDNFRQFDIVREIHERNNYVLCSQSDGDPPERQICIYKEAQDFTYLVTPEDIRHTDEEEEEETNPFLRSITKHMKATERGFTSDTPILDKLIKFFIEFSEEEYTEFRFLGPFKMNEVEAIGVFLGVIACLSKNQPLVVPEELLKAFNKDTRYAVQEDINGYATIKKTQQGMQLSSIE